MNLIINDTSNKIYTPRNGVFGTSINLSTFEMEKPKWPNIIVALKYSYNIQL